jgi:hypothetical protein
VEDDFSKASNEGELGNHRWPRLVSSFHQKTLAVVMYLPPVDLWMMAPLGMQHQLIVLGPVPQVSNKDLKTNLPFTSPTFKSGC